MTLQYEVTETDYIDFNLYHITAQQRGRLPRKLLPIFWLVVVLLFGVVLVVDYLQKGYFNMQRHGRTVTLLLLMSALVAVYLFAFKPIIRASVRTQLKNGKLPSFIGAQILTLGEDCISGSTGTSSSQTAYSVIEKIVLHDGWCYIYISSMQAFLVPLAALPGPEQQAAFFAILKQHTGLDPVPA